MALIVQKYGGTSVGSPERIKNVARRIARWKAKGHQLVDRKSTRLNSSHIQKSRMPSSA